MSDTSREASRIALLLAEYPTGPNTSETLLRISQENNVWNSGYHYGRIHVHPGSAQARRLARGSVDQAAGIAQATSDQELLTTMARREKRRLVRAALAGNEHLPYESVPVLWDKELVDAQNTGADGEVIARLMQRTPVDKVEGRISEALALVYTTQNFNPWQEIAEAASTALCAAGGGNVATRVAQTLHKSAQQTGHDRYVKMRDHFIAAHTEAVFHGTADVDLDTWCDRISRIGGDTAQAAAGAAWTAAIDKPRIVTDVHWVTMARDAWATADNSLHHPRRAHLHDNRYGRLMSVDAGKMAHVFRNMPTAVAVDVATNASVALIPLLVRHADDLPIQAWEALVKDNSNQGEVSEHHSTLVRKAIEPDRRELMLEVAPPVGTHYSDVDYAWGDIVETVPLDVDTIVRIVNGAATLMAWARGVNRPTTVDSWTAVVGEQEPGDTRYNDAIATVLEREQQLDSALFHHLWKTTPGLPERISRSYDGTLRGYTVEQLIAELGDDDASWDTLVRLWSTWTGSFGDLLGVVKTL